MTQPAKILVIDDEPMLCETIADYLGDNGYQTLTARDGEQGLTLFKAEKPDAILVDLNMPKIDGFGVLKEVSHASPNTPVIVVSGIGIIQEGIRAVRLGAWDFITKPIDDLDVIAHSLKKALERARLIKENNNYREHLENLVSERTSELEEEIARRKETEERIKTSLKEKEVLLKEIHHRVKNNLQVITSLLRLQAGKVDDEKSQQAFSESQHRIFSMALVHEELYKSPDLSSIDFNSYLHKLVPQMIHSMGHGRQTDYDIKTKNAYISIEAAIPCGLILNELISNAIKHGSPESDNCRLDILVEKENDKITVNVRDNGRGLPPGFDFEENPSLGTQLVSGLTKQLKGSVNHSNEEGANIRITFQDKPQENGTFL